MSRLGFADLRAHLEEGRLAVLYALLGEETFFRQEALAALKRRLFGLEAGGKPPPGSVSVLEGTSVAPADVLDEVATSGFFAEAKLVVLENADAFLKAHHVGPEFLERLRQRAGLSVLVLITPGLDGRTAFARAAEKAGVLIDCGPLSTRGPNPKLRAWVKQRAAHHGLNLARGAEDELIERAGVSLLALDQELLKLALYVADRGAGASARTGDVEALIDRNRTFLIYELTDAVIRSDRGRALRLAGELIEQGMAPEALLGALGAQFRRLWLIKHRLAAGASVQEACREAGVRQQFLWQRTAQAARTRSAEDLARSLHLIAEADCILKGQKGLALERPLLLEMLVLKLCGAPEPAEAR